MAQVKVFNLGGIGSPCCCSPVPPPGTGNLQVCVLHCAVGASIPYLCGATVAVKLGATTIASGMLSPSTGCVTFSSLAPLSYTVIIAPSIACYPTTTTSVSVMSGMTTTTTVKLVPAMGYTCCGEATTLPATVTDANGTWPITYGGGLTAPTAFALSPPTVNPCFTNIMGCACNQNDSINYYYTVQCTGNRQYTVGRYWDTIPYFLINGAACGTQSQYLSVSTSPFCNSEFIGFNLDFSTGILTFTTCSCSPASSGSLTPDAGNFLPDPVGGTVVLA